MMKQKPSIRLYWNRFRYGFNAFFFLRGIGPLARKFEDISDPADRASFACEHFGKSWCAVLGELHANR